MKHDSDDDGESGSTSATPQSPPYVYEDTTTTTVRRCKLSSKKVFMRFVKFLPNNEVDVSGIFSRECYNEWLASRKMPPRTPEESFRRSLIAHIAGKDDRKPFDCKVEEALLKRLRKREAWPTFAGNTDGTEKIGERGIKSHGYHEARRMKQNVAPNAQSLSSPALYSFSKTDTEQVSSGGAANNDSLLGDPSVDATVEEFTMFIYERAAAFHTQPKSKFLTNTTEANMIALCKYFCDNYSLQEIRAFAQDNLASSIVSHSLHRAMAAQSASFDIIPQVQALFNSEAFLCPDVSNYHPTRPVGKIYRSRDKVLVGDQIANELYGRNLTGLGQRALFCNSNLYNQHIASAHYEKRFQEAIVRGAGERCLTRGVVLTDHCTRVLLFEIIQYNRNTSEVIIQVQDESDKFPFLHAVRT